LLNKEVLLVMYFSDDMVEHDQSWFPLIAEWNAITKVALSSGLSGEGVQEEELYLKVGRGWAAYPIQTE
jgi:hypothetical protein